VLVDVDDKSLILVYTTQPFGEAGMRNSADSIDSIGDTHLEHAEDGKELL
jgi:hypothetical protein